MSTIPRESVQFFVLDVCSQAIDVVRANGTGELMYMPKAFDGL